jgi:glycosyltransferase involved in cell wall biosynthesis
MEPFSVVITTYNSEKYLKLCLESVHDLADEIIIVDGFSTDNTAKIANAFPKVKFHSYSWKGYSETKNYGNELAQNQWILSLDSDEVLDFTLYTSIKNAMQRPLGIYSFNRLNHYCGKYIYCGGWGKDIKQRLFNKTLYKWKGDIHEHLLAINTEIEPNINFLEGNLLHYSYDSVKEHYSKIEKYSTLAANKLKTKNKIMLALKAVVSPLFRFFKEYALLMGFLDGKQGFQIAKLNAYEVFLKYKKAVFIEQ